MLTPSILEESSMTERFAETSKRNTEVHLRDHQDRLASPHVAEPGGAAPVPRAGRVNKPLTLAAVLHHVLQTDNPIQPTSASFGRGTNDEPALRRVNRVLCTVLESCLQLDAVRQQLQGAIATQHELELLLEMVAARVEWGQITPMEHRLVVNRLSSSRDVVTRTVGEWNRTGRRFTQLTHLLPVQLEIGFDALAPVLTDEMDSLANACLSARADVHFSLNQRALAWATRRKEPARDGERSPKDFGAWMSSLEEARAQAAADFACARESYLQAVLEFDQKHASLVRARSLRRTAETGFRLNTRSPSEFAEATLEESRRNHAMLLSQANRRSAQYHLYALAGLLPRHFGLVEPAAGY